MELGALFQDGAVLQRRMYIPVWGVARPRARIRAGIAGMEAYCISDSDGRFMLRIPPMEAGGPHVLTVEETDGDGRCEVRDVLVGEVWLASGQSNMSYPLGNSTARPESSTGAELSTDVCQTQYDEFKRLCVDGDRFRFFTVECQATGQVCSRVKGRWQRYDPENIDMVSAVASWFGRFLRDALDMPVGIVVSAWGGTFVEGWTSRSGLLSNPDTAPMVHELDSIMSLEETWSHGTELDKEAFYASLTVKDPGNKGLGLGYASCGFDDSGWKPMEVPGSWIGQGIAGNGALWIRREVELPESWAGRDLTLHTGAIDKHDIAYFNGVEVGRTGKDFEDGYWTVKRAYHVPASLVKAGVNQIAIRAYSFLYDGAFSGKPHEYILSLNGSGEKLPLAGEWKAFAEFDMGKLPVPDVLAVLGPGNPYTPAILFDSMIAPLIPYGIKGVVWYQGENNAIDMDRALKYRRSLDAMIRDWRFRWGQGDFEFIQVQLANFRQPALYDGGAIWPVLREGQRLVCGDLPGVRMATAIDAGDVDDIHPQDKKTVGFRLARQALRWTYCMPGIVPEGPVFLGVSHEGTSLRVQFDYAEGLSLAEGGEASFWLAGADGRFHQADSAVVQGCSLLLSSKEVARPVHVRYAWADNPQATLFNGAGLPAASFSSL